MAYKTSVEYRDVLITVQRATEILFTKDKRAGLLRRVVLMDMLRSVVIRPAVENELSLN